MPKFNTMDLAECVKYLVLLKYCIKQSICFQSAELSL